MMFQTEQISIVIVTAALFFAFWYISKEIKSLRNDETPSRLTAAAISYVEWINNYTINTMGDYYGPKFSAYIGSIFIYLLVSNISGLVGLPAPTGNFSVTLVFAVITW